jgi:hypothetical protein
VLIMTVMPSRNPDGGRAYSGRGQLFDGVVEGRVIVRRSAQPLLDGCRALLAEGVDPATPITMRHDGSTVDSLTATVGAAAGLTVREGDKLPAFQPYQPYDASFHAPGSAPVSQTEGAATPIA